MQMEEACRNPPPPPPLLGAAAAPMRMRALRPPPPRYFSFGSAPRAFSQPSWHFNRMHYHAPAPPRPRPPFNHYHHHHHSAGPPPPPQQQQQQTSVFGLPPAFNTHKKDATVAMARLVAMNNAADVEQEVQKCVVHSYVIVLC